MVNVVTQIALCVPYQGGWTVFQIRDGVGASPVLVAVGGFGEELSLGGFGAGGGGGSRGGGRGFGGWLYGGRRRSRIHILHIGIGCRQVAVRSVGVVDVVTVTEFCVPDQGCWTVFQPRFVVGATPVLVAIGGFGEELSLGGFGAGGCGGSRGGGCWFGG